MVMWYGVVRCAGRGLFAAVVLAIIATELGYSAASKLQQLDPIVNSQLPCARPH